MTSAIKVTGLRKSYGDKVVLDGIDLEVPAGTVFALLGAQASPSSAISGPAGPSIACRSAEGRHC